MVERRVRFLGSGSRRRGGYVLLETVIATGMLILGLAVIGSQLQSAQKSVRMMERKMRAMALADLQLGQLDLGLVELQALNKIEENDFGPRYPDWGWRLLIEETSIPTLYSMQLEVQYLRREGEYSPETFDHDRAETIYTLYAMRPTPQPVNLATSFNLTDQEYEELDGKLSKIGRDGLGIENFDFSLLGKIDFEEFLEVLPALADAMNIKLDSILASLPPDLRALVEEAQGDTSGDQSGGQGGQGGGGGSP
ncbi:MAG: hypothetical protein J5J06_09245 [Phycisphaerae bacterium]|nr:hypothetical protein [Phycisphaerae bacterium]